MDEWKYLEQIALINSVLPDHIRNPVSRNGAREWLQMSRSFRAS